MKPLLPSALTAFLQGKSSVAIDLFVQLYQYYVSIGVTEQDVEVTKTTIAFGLEKRYCYMYQFSKNFVSGVIKLPTQHDDPEIFFKTGQLSATSYAHHFRLYEKKDLTPALKKYLKQAKPRNN